MHAGLNAHPALNRPANLPAQRPAQLAPGRGDANDQRVGLRRLAKRGINRNVSSDAEQFAGGAAGLGGVDQPDHLAKRIAQHASGGFGGERRGAPLGEQKNAFGLGAALAHCQTISPPTMVMTGRPFSVQS